MDALSLTTIPDLVHISKPKGSIWRLGCWPLHISKEREAEQAKGQAQNMYALGTQASSSSIYLRTSVVHSSAHICPCANGVPFFHTCNWKTNTADGKAEYTDC